ncbi:aldehyde dehydrogenase family protein [Phorcysia thermohydrogeniphila]|uniref:Acyl-CoA reductase-like NAD-dependent aldehyde dehydrogenase n=1 Tax=Phorcysia thermohydrogeniphila TaxID=936138 RepID=A0A4R1GF94_9BACT|nr:aldehyde dehydrogenase family protein [Phorcysia thermohydrogeniphila]TCK05355.1 acyl-CoA reductase-like NAD-dependent aldehyde dehydrogenase [Phorcysia thermohydrogeniphila]
MKGYMLIGGKKVFKHEEIEIFFPYDGSLIGTIPRGKEEDVKLAVEAAKVGFEKMKKMTAYERYQCLQKAARILSSRAPEFAELLTLEVGKTIKESMGEVGRAVNTITLAAEEAKRVLGEEVPFDAAPGIKNKVGFYRRVPIGLIGCITPFNFPLNLTCHKVAPALAAGNSVIIKPSENTSLTVIKLAEVLIEAGFPPEAVNVVTGYGEEAGDALVRNSDVRMITFTGSVETGKIIMSRGGLKKYAMELGSNAGVYIDEDQEEKLTAIAEKVARGGFALAGQVCISVQRVFVHEKLFEQFVEEITKFTKTLKVGDPRKEETDVGPVIDKNAADRIMEWIEEAVALGGQVVCGGRRLSDTLIEPTIVTNVPEKAKLFSKEVFGPVILVNRVSGLEEGIKQVNNSPYGLQAGIFTNNIKAAFKFVEEVECGGIMVNEIPTFRVDQMPYGGVKESGIGREGPHFAIEEMTEIKTICFDLN